MGNQGAKKRLDQNAKWMFKLRIAFIVGILAQLSGLGLALARGSSISSWLWLGTALSIATSWFTYSSIAGFAAPIWGKEGELLDGGSDLGMGGMCGYYHDILYVSVFVQVTSLISSWFWMFYLLIPAYGLYKLLILVIQPYFQKPAISEDGQMSETMRKKLEKTEKRAERRRQKRF